MQPRQKYFLESHLEKNVHFRVESAGLVLPKYKAIDIYTLDDWELAEALYRGLYMHQES